MTNQELADKIVALGIGSKSGFKGGYYMDWDAMDWDALECEVGLDEHDAETFTNDWRVAGAMLEMYYDAFATVDAIVDAAEAEPRAINEACAEALL